MEISFLEEFVVVEAFDLERLSGNPRIYETVEEFLARKREFVSQIVWPPGIEFECKKCGDCCTWSFIPLNIGEEVVRALRELAKYPHGSWIMKEDRQIMVQMPGYVFMGSIPPVQTEYINRTGRYWGYWVLNARGEVVLYNPTPCIHLTEDKICGIYEERPRFCKEYSCRRHPILRTAEYYDDVFERQEAYRCPPEESHYYPLWAAVLSLIKHPVKILDIGCGPGQFAALCAEAGHKYVGLDWSKVAIEIGREGPGEFHLVDLQQDRTHFNDDYDVATFIEFLEHVPDDLEILADVPRGRTVILTVPDYPGAEHFRFFSDLDQVTHRYQPLITIAARMILSGKSRRGRSVKMFVLKGIRR